MELVEKSPSTSSSRSRGLFEDLIQSRPEVLLQDALEHPGAYDEDVIDLLSRMVENRKLAITDDEVEKLNLATAEFFSASPGKPKEKPKTTVQMPRRVPTAPVEEPMDIPSQNAFWWT